MFGNTSMRGRLKILIEEGVVEKELRTGSEVLREARYQLS